MGHWLPHNVGNLSDLNSANPRLLGALRKTVLPGGLRMKDEKLMKCICPCFTPSRIALAESAHESSLPWLGTLIFIFCVLWNRLYDDLHYMI